MLGGCALNDPRPTDTLANERTFLAYARTALAFIAFGFVIARFALFTREVASVVHIHMASAGVSTAFGTLMAIFGIACGAYGAYRYVVTARALRAGSNAAMPDSAAIGITIAITIIGALVTYVLLSAR